MTLTVVGAGYVCLVTAAVFAELGNKVFCIDINKERIKGLKRGKIPFFEPSLSEYIKRNYQAKRLFFTELGNKVFCIDINKERIKGLKRGKIPFFEPSLSEYIKRSYQAKRLFF